MADVTSDRINTTNAKVLGQHKRIGMKLTL